MDAKDIIIEDLRSLAWYCHKELFDADYARVRYYRFWGTVLGLYKADLIDMAYYRMMIENARRLLNKAEIKHAGRGKDDGYVA